MIKIIKEQPDFSKFNLGMFRQWFGELPKDEIFTAEQIWDMLDQACPLLPKTTSRTSGSKPVSLLGETTQCIIEDGKFIISGTK